MNTTINAIYDRFYDTGRIEAMKCNWKEGMDKKPHFFWDSDVAKWMEGAAYILAKHEDKSLEARVEEIIDAIEENQGDDGYYNVYFTVVRPENRFSYRGYHELYCAGHLMEAAVAYYYATGKDRFLKIMEKYADYIYKVFAEEKSAGFTTPGHEEIEIALLRMYKCTGKKKYLNLCKFFIDERGTGSDSVDNPKYNPKYCQSDRPLRSLESAEGHCVRALYLYTSMAALAHEINDKELLDACKRLFDDIVKHKMYITGGTGSTHIGEAFTVPYDLPSEHAYTETCAGIALMFFAQEMLKIENKSIYADTVERAMYNGMISGLSLDGKAFSYENPLQITLRNRTKNTSSIDKERYPATQRREIFGCSCCPPNINRVLSSMEKYIYHTSNDIYYVDQFMQSSFEENGAKIMQATEYPQNGQINLDFTGIEKAAVRIPGWCDNFKINAEYEIKDGYAYITNPGSVEIEFELIPALYMAHQEVNDCANKAALMYGPVVYCAEGIDNNNINLSRLYIDKNLNADILPYAETGLNKITVDGYIRKTSDALYSRLNDCFEKTKITLVPYYSFANHGESDMTVWMNYR